jgi:hypothetical protein
MSREQFPVNHPEAWPTEMREQLEKDRALRTRDTDSRDFEER